MGRRRGLLCGGGGQCVYVSEVGHRKMAEPSGRVEWTTWFEGLVRVIGFEPATRSSGTRGAFGSMMYVLGTGQWWANETP